MDYFVLEVLCKKKAAENDLSGELRVEKSSPFIILIEKWGRNRNLEENGKLVA